MRLALESCSPHAGCGKALVMAAMIKPVTVTAILLYNIFFCIAIFSEGKQKNLQYPRYYSQCF